MLKKEKVAYIENVRCVALVLVVLIHVVAIPIQNWNDDVEGFLFYSVSYSIGCCGVPIFLLISGSLLLNPDRSITVHKIYTRMIPRILLPLCVFGYIFALMEILFETHTVSLGMFIDAVMRVLNKESWGHLWYLYMLLGIYICLPILRFLNENLNEEMYRYFTFLLIALAYVLPTINSVFGLSISFGTPSPLCHITAFWLGGTLLRYSKNEKFNKHVTFLGIVSFVIIIATGLFCPLFGKENYAVIASYDDVFVIGSAMLFYLIVRKFAPNECGGVLRDMADCSFGIYLIHPVIMNVLYKVLDIRPDYYFHMISIPLFVIAFITPSLICVAVMKRIPWIKKLV